MLLGCRFGFACWLFAMILGFTRAFWFAVGWFVFGLMVLISVFLFVCLDAVLVVRRFGSWCGIVPGVGWFDGGVCGGVWL